MRGPGLGLFVLATLLVSLSPGPNVFLLVSLGLRDGALAVLKATAGIAVASLLFLLVSALGLVAVLTASTLLFSVVCYAGAAYLVYLGLRMLVGSRSGEGSAELQARPLPQPFLQGCVTHLANPKAMLYWAALLPQFVDAQRPLAAQVLLLGTIAIVLDLIILASYGLFAAAARRSAVSQRFYRLINLTAGLFFMAAGLLLAVTRLHTP